MRFFRLACTHGRIAARQRALWVVSLALALASMATSLGTGMAFETNKVADLAFLAQVLALLPPVVYAAAFTDLVCEPERLGIAEVESSTPVASIELVAARIAGALFVMVLPSAAVLLFCGCGQTLHGNLGAIPQSVVLLTTVVVPAALLATSLSACAGALLPRAVARIAAVALWCAALFSSFVGVAVPGGGVKFHFLTDPICQAFFGSPAFLDYDGPASVATPLQAVVFLAAKLALAVALLWAAGVVARRRKCRHG